MSHRLPNSTAAAALLRARRARRLSDRDGLRPRRRRDQRPGRRRDLRRQGTAALQPADRPRRRRRVRRRGSRASTRAPRRSRARFWPGPLSLVLPRRADCPISLLASAGLDTSRAARRRPIRWRARSSAPSAARSPRRAPTAPAASARPTAEHVARRARRPHRRDPRWRRLPRRPRIDGARSQRRARRRCCGPAASRSRSSRRLIGPIDVADAADDAPRAPGMLASHYAPSLPLRLDATTVKRDEALLAFGPRAPPGAKETAGSAARGDLERGRGQSLRHAARARPAGLRRHRGDADPRARARPRDQRPPAPRRRTAPE